MERRILLSGKLAAWCYLGLVFAIATPTHAHLLNMTRCIVRVDTEKSLVEVTLEIDFTRLLGDPVSYYEFTQLQPAERSAQRERLINSVEAGLELLVNGDRVRLRNSGFQLPDLPLSKFVEPWAAPMSELSFVGDLLEGSSELYLVSDPRLKIEFPLVVSLQLSTDSDFSITRWLEPGQKSPVLEFEMEAGPSVTSLVSEQLDRSDSFKGTASRYLVLGFEHILPKGLDHILFVLGLFFLTHRWRPLLLQVSLFTVAHTITLMFVALGVIPYLPGVVEPLIALSIVYVGIENIWRSQINKLRLVVVFGFGLIHGMGFAGMLGEIGFSRDEFLTALIAFNVGVELGQVVIIALAYVVCFRLFQHTDYNRLLRIPLNVGISAVAGLWFFQRILV